MFCQMLQINEYILHVSGFGNLIIVFQIISLHNLEEYILTWQGWSIGVCFLFSPAGRLGASGLVQQIKVFYFRFPFAFLNDCVFCVYAGSINLNLISCWCEFDAKPDYDIILGCFHNLRFIFNVWSFPVLMTREILTTLNLMSH